MLQSRDRPSLKDIVESIKNNPKPIPNRPVQKALRYRLKAKPVRANSHHHGWMPNIVQASAGNKHIGGDRSASMNDRSEIPNELIEIIQRKISAEDVTADWVLAFLGIKMIPILKEIANNLQAIDGAIAPPKLGNTVHGQLY